MSARSAWRVFGVSASSAVQWAQQWRKTGNLDAGKVGGHKRVILESERDWLLNRIEIKQDLTLHELLAELRDERGVVVCCDTLWRFLGRFLGRHGKTYKKDDLRKGARPAQVASAAATAGAGSSAG
jgi:transposase